MKTTLLNRNIPFFLHLSIFATFFSTTACKKKSKNLPVLTLQKHIVDVNRASFDSYVLKFGDEEIIERAICWNTDENPSIANNSLKKGKGKGIFDITINGLKTQTTYYVRAYAKNANGIAYSNQVTIQTQKIPAVGDHVGGGIVVYIYQPNDLNYVVGETHGLIADLTDISTGIPWGCEGYIFTTNNNYAAIGMGKSNTEHILDVCTDKNTASEICNNHTINGYDDWFLPSKDELNLLYLNQQMIGGFGDAFYWSSTEYSLLKVHMQYLTTGVTYYGAKTATLRVRAVREF